MISTSTAKPDPQAAIIVFGRPSSPDLPQASWFKAVDMEAAEAAAEQMKFTVIELRTEKEKALAIGVHEGVLKGSGRMIVGSVTQEVYRRIEEYARKAAGGDPASATKLGEDVSSGAKASADPKASLNNASAADPAVPVAASAGKSETNPAGAASLRASVEPPSPTAPWESLRVGGTVLAAYWNDAGKVDGFWLTTIKRFAKSGVVIDWPDAPDYPSFRAKLKNIAILHPEFDVSGK